MIHTRKMNKTLNPTMNEYMHVTHVVTDIYDTK